MLRLQQQVPRLTLTHATASLAAGFHSTATCSAGSESGSGSAFASAAVRDEPKSNASPQQQHVRQHAAPSATVRAAQTTSPLSANEHSSQLRADERQQSQTRQAADSALRTLVDLASATHKKRRGVDSQAAAAAAAAAAAQARQNSANAGRSQQLTALERFKRRYGDQVDEDGFLLEPTEDDRKQFDAIVEALGKVAQHKALSEKHAEQLERQQMIDRVDKNPARAQSAQLPLGSGDDQDPRIQKLLNKMSHKPQLVDSELLRQSAEAAGQALNVVTKSARPAHVAAMDAFRPTAITEAIATLAEQFKRPANPSQPRRPVIPAPMQEPSTVQPRSKETTTPERDAEPTPDSPAQAPTIPRGRGRRRRGVKESQPVHEPDDLTSPVDPRVQRLVDQELFKIFGPGKDGQSAATPLDESDSHPDEEMQMMESAAEDEVPRRGRLTRQKLAKLARLERLQEREAQRQERLAAEYDEADNVDAEEPEMEHNGEAEEPDNPFDAEEQLQAMHQQLAKARQVKTRQIRARIAALRRQGPDQPSEDTPAAAREAYAAALAAAVPKASMAPELDDTTNEPMHDDELAEELTMAERDVLSVERSEQLRERRANADDPTSMSFKRRVEQEYMDTFDLTGDWSLPVRAQREVRRAIVERIRNEEKSGMQLRLGKLRLAESEEALSLQRAKDRRSQMIANALLKATLKIIVHDSRIPAALRQAVEKSQMEIRGVHVSPDYRLAKLYWRPTSLSSPAQVDTIRDLLTANTSHLRFAVQEKLNLKYSPELRFVLDSAEEDVDQVSAILDRATREDHDASSKPKLASDPSLAIGSFRRLSTPRQS